MENLGGSLGFKATLDIDDFNVSADAMERHIKDFSQSAADEVDSVEEAFRKMTAKAGEYISYYLVGQGMKQLVMSIVQVRGQFQQLEIAFETMLGSSEKANALMKQMVDTAAKTPFDLMGVAEGAKQLMAYGTSADKVNDTLVRLGNIASGLSIPLNDIVYLYGTTMVQGRLYAQDVRQFTGRGIPLVKELANMYGKNADEINAMVSAGKIGFADVEKVLNKMTDAGGQFYNLMEKQSASLTGQISNLQDAWDGVLNSWGEAGQDVFAAGISSATYLVDHMDDVVRILKAVAIAYGSVKAAIILNSVATKGYTGVAVIDNTVRSAKLVLMKAESVVTGTLSAQKKAMTAAEKEHFAAMEATLTAEEKAAIVKQMRIAAIQSLLTAQQQEYLSNINLTTTSEGYVAAAMGVMTAEQKLALSKMDLTAKSAAYKAAVLQEAQAKATNQAQSVAAMRITVKEAVRNVEAAKASAIAATQRTEAARYEVYWAKQSGNATAIAAAQKKLEAAVDNQAMAHKGALAAQSDFYAKKKQFETAATLQARTASIADTAAKGAQTAATSILSAATGKLSAGLKALWATMVANPIGAILSVVGLLISAFMMLGDKEEDAAEGMNKFGDSSGKQAGNLNALFGVLTAGEKGTKTYKKALEEVNAELKEHGLALLGEESSLKDIEDAHDRIKNAIKKENAEKERANALDNISQEYRNKLDEIGEKIHNELKGAHHYNADWALSFDSEDIQANATALATQIRGVIEDKLPDIAKLDDSKKEEAKKALRDQITEIMMAAGIDKDHAALITDYSFLDDWYYDVFSEKGGIIDQAVEAQMAFDSQAEAANNAANAIKGMGEAAEEVTPKSDMAKFSLEELHDLASKLSGTEVGIDIKVYGYTDAMQMLADVNAQISGKQAGLNTESGINSEIQSLKQLRSEAQLGSQAWKDYDKQITALQNRLDNATGRGRGSHRTSGGGKGGQNDAARNAEVLKDKQLAADKRLEEARLAVMEEGYAKRKAALDLQHKEALKQIDKEEKELKEARKKAGKGDLTKEEKAGFTERRSLENQGYEQEKNKLFEGELDYKKKQYALYFRWVENMGKEVADKQFASLLKGGASYKDYVNAQIKELNAKKDAGTLSEGDGNYLIQLNAQYDELTGAKTALESFKEQVNESINRCTTLAEKIEVVAKAQQKLDNGESGIVSADDRATANLGLSQQGADLQKQLNDKVLKDYRTYEEQKQDIIKDYAKMREVAEKEGNQERIDLINQGEQNALSALNTSFLQQSDSWKKLFSDLDTLSVGQIQKLVKDVQGQLNRGDLKLSPVDYKAVVDSLNQAKQRIEELNPFKALGQYFKDYSDAKKKLADLKVKEAAGGATKAEVDAAEREVGEAAKGMSDSIKQIEEISTKCAQSLQSMFDALGMDGAAEALGTAIELMGELGNVAASVDKIMEGDVVGGVSGLVGAVTSVVGIFAKLHDKKYEKRIQNLQKQLDALERAYSRLERAFNNTYWVFNDAEREGFEKNIHLIEQQIAALEQQRNVAKRSWDMAKYAQLTAQIKELNAQLSKAKEGDDMLGLWQREKESLVEQQKLINDQIYNEQKKKKTDNGKISSWQDQIEQINKQIEDLDRQMMETFAGTDVKSAIDQFADAIVDAYCAGEDAAKSLGETTKAVLKKAVVEALKRNFLAKGINDAIEFLGKSMEDGTLTDEEKARFEMLANQAGETFKNSLEAIGDWIKDIDEETTTDPLTGAVASMSEETAGVIAGRLNAFIINQAAQTSVLRDQLLAQSDIARNTAISAQRLEQIEQTLKRIETKDNTLLSQGIS